MYKDVSLETVSKISRLYAPPLASDEKEFISSREPARFNESPKERNRFVRNKEEQRCLVRCPTLVERKEWLAATVPTAKLNDCISEMWFTREKYSLRTISVAARLFALATSVSIVRTYIRVRLLEPEAYLIEAK